MGKQHLIQLIRKYLNGKASPEEKRQLDAWWHYHVNDETYLKSLPETDQQQLFEGMLTDVWQRIDNPTAQTPGVVRPLPVARSRYGSAGRWMASVGAVLLVSLLAFLYAGRQPVVETAYGERREVRLPDGSVVMLNGNSSIRYGHWTDSAPREVWLTGEAFFTVTHTKNHQRFVVYTPDHLRVEVLGTRFNVNSRHAATRVVLAEGQVRVTNARQQSVVMRPGQQLRHEEARSNLTLTSTDVPRQLSWRDKQLLFDNQPLGAVLAQLQDSHGLRVSIRVEELESQPFSGSVPTDAIEQIFGKVEKIYGVRVRQEGDGFIIENP